MDAKLKSQIIITAIVTRVDGTVEDLGEIVNTNKDNEEKNN